MSQEKVVVYWMQLGSGGGSMSPARRLCASSVPGVKSIKCPIWMEECRLDLLSIVAGGRETHTTRLFGGAGVPGFQVLARFLLPENR